MEEGSKPKEGRKEGCPNAASAKNRKTNTEQSGQQKTKSQTEVSVVAAAPRNRKGSEHDGVRDDECGSALDRTISPVDSGSALCKKLFQEDRRSIMIMGNLVEGLKWTDLPNC